LKALLVLGLRPVRPSWAEKALPTGIGPVEGERYKREEREKNTPFFFQKENTYVFLNALSLSLSFSPEAKQ